MFSASSRNRAAASPQTCYGQWDSGVIRVDGRIAPGEKLKLVSEANSKRTFSLKVTEFRPGERMTWEGGMPLGLFRGRELFSGWSLTIIEHMI